MNDHKDCRIATDDAIRIAGDLNEFVVTFDQIFSRIAFGGYGPELLVEYMTDRDVRKRLAKAREIVFDALEKEIGEGEAESIAERGHRYFE